MKVFFTQKKLLFSFFILMATISSIGQSLRFTDTSYVNLGNASSLHLTNFTIEARIKIEGYGSTTETGSTGTGGGQTGVVPIITKGRAQSESASVDINYFLGYRLSDMKLVADFEDNSIFIESFRGKYCYFTHESMDPGRCFIQCVNTNMEAFYWHNGSDICIKRRAIYASIRKHCKCLYWFFIKYRRNCPPGFL